MKFKTLQGAPSDAGTSRRSAEDGQKDESLERKDLHSLSTKTVGNYVSNIFTKLQVADRAQAIIRAREAGLG